MLAEFRMSDNSLPCFAAPCLLGLVFLFLLGLFSVTQAGTFDGKRVLYIDSYHAGNPWSDNITWSIQKTFEGSGIELRIHRMDTRRNNSEGFKKQAGLRAKAVIEAFAPDLVIVSDDNAVKYVLQPYYRDAALPFVFCGVNWDAAKGDRIGRLAEIYLSSKKMSLYHKKIFGLRYDKEYFVDNFEDWKKAYLKLQEEVDILIIGAPFTIRGWNLQEATTFAERHIKIPTGTTVIDRMPYALMGYTRFPEEQGNWASETAFRILDGVAPKSIKVTQNKRGKLLLNRRLIRKLGIVVD